MRLVNCLLVPLKWSIVVVVSLFVAIVLFDPGASEEPTMFLVVERRRTVAADSSVRGSWMHRHNLFRRGDKNKGQKGKDAPTAPIAEVDANIQRIEDSVEQARLAALENIVKRDVEEQEVNARDNIKPQQIIGPQPGEAAVDSGAPLVISPDSAPPPPPPPPPDKSTAKDHEHVVEISVGPSPPPSVSNQPDVEAKKTPLGSGAAQEGKAIHSAAVMQADKKLNGTNGTAEINGTAGMNATADANVTGDTNITGETNGTVHTNLPSNCPDFTKYASVPHPPLSGGSLKLPFQRPREECRTFVSPLVEQVIHTMKEKLDNPDLARLFENCFPNTLDTTVRWFTAGPPARTFVVTGDINAEWIRDSQRQLMPYIPLATKDATLKNLILGTMNQYVEFLMDNPYCNAFNPPKDSKIPPTSNQQVDVVFPDYNVEEVFECKYELDSIASFFALANDYFACTDDASFVTKRWVAVAKKLMQVIMDQQLGTYDDDGNALNAKYSFERHTNVGSETLALSGEGYPVNSNTSLIRSAFRPSDDATIYQFFIPANAQIAVELQKAHPLLSRANERTRRIWPINCTN